VGVFAIATIISLVMFNTARNAQRTAENEAEARATQQSIAEAESIRAAQEADARATQQAIAEAESSRASNEARQSFARELSASALNVLDLDPQLSVLLSLQAVEETYSVDGVFLPETQLALHSAIQGTADRKILSFENEYTNVRKIAFSPDGNRLVTYGTMNYYPRWQTDGLTQVWDALNGELLLTLPGILASDEWLFHERLATLHNSDDDSWELTFWNASTGEVLSSFDISPQLLDPDNASTQAIELTDRDIDSLILSPSWRYFSLSLSPVDTVLNIVWDLTTQEEVFRSQNIGHPVSEIMSVAFSPIEDLMLSGKFTGLLHVWDLESGELKYEISDLTWKVSIMDIAFHPNGEYFVSASSCLVEHVALGGGEETISGLDCNSGRPRYAGEEAVVGDAVILWDIETGDERLSLFPTFEWPFSGWGERQNTELMSDIVWHAEFNSVGDLLATINPEGIVTIWDAFTGKVILTLQISSSDVTDISFSPNSSFLAISESDGKISVWDIRSDFGYELMRFSQGIAISTTGSEISSFSLSLEGTQFVTTIGDGTHLVVDSNTGEFQVSLEGPREIIRHVSYNPSGSLIGALSKEGSFRLWEALTGDLALSIPGFYGCCFAFDPHGDKLAISTNAFNVSVYDLDVLLESGSIYVAQDISVQQTLEEYAEIVPVQDIVFSSDGNSLAILYENGDIRFFKTDSGDLISIQQTNAMGFAVHSQEPILAIAQLDGSISIFDLDKWEGIQLLSGHSTPVTHLAFSNSTYQLVSISRDGTTIFWDVLSGEILQSFTINAPRISGLALSPDGTRLYVATADGTVRVYLLNIDELIELANSRLTRWFTTEECQTFLHTDTCPPPP
jgi:WD40 repeat protein